MKEFIQKEKDCFILTTDDLVLHIDAANGCVRQAAVRNGDAEEVWEAYAGDVSVRDDLLGFTFGRDVQSMAQCGIENDALVIHKTFCGAPWVLTESYRKEGNALAWEAVVSMSEGKFRSCAISWNLPWPQPVFECNVWAPCGGMPTPLFRLSGRTFEYGEVTSGIGLPALVTYNEKRDIGIALAMPFDYQTPRFRFKMGFRDPDLAAEFDFLALSADHAAKAKLLLCGTCGHWRPALGRLYERYREYFEPQSETIDALWGGHICGTFHEKEDAVKDMTRLGIKWYEVHGHFPAYGNYHPEGMKTWRSGHFLDNTEMISVDTVHETIDLLHRNGVAAFPYIQINGDGDAKLLPPEMESCRICNRRGDTWGGWPGTLMMNARLDNPFGKDIVRQIDGFCERYAEMDGAFLDQSGYNFIDTAHDDHITAIDNRPASMTGFAYFPHLEHLSKNLHPKKSIIANGAFGIGLAKHLDGFMNEGDSEILESHQYYALGRKPIFLLVYDTNDICIEIMFQSALLHAAGFASYPAAMPSRDLYDKYMPLVQKLYRRRWIFDKDPIKVPAGFKGNIFRGETGSLLIPLVRSLSRVGARSAAAEEKLEISVPGAEKFTRCTLSQPGKPDVALNATVGDNNRLAIELVPEMTAGVIELAF